MTKRILVELIYGDFGRNQVWTGVSRFHLGWDEIKHVYDLITATKRRRFHSDSKIRGRGDVLERKAAFGRLLTSSWAWQQGFIVAFFHHRKADALAPLSGVLILFGFCRNLQLIRRSGRKAVGKEWSTSLFSSYTGLPTHPPHPTTIPLIGIRSSHLRRNSFKSFDRRRSLR